MLSLGQLQTAAAMPRWSHAELIAFVRERTKPGDVLVPVEALPSVVETELTATRDGDGWDVRIAPSPRVRPREEDRWSKLLCDAIERRGALLVRLVRAALDARLRLTGAALADVEGLPVSSLEHIVRAHRVALDGAIVPFDALVDLDGVVETTRRDLRLDGTVQACMDPRGLGDASVTEWPNNVLSTRTVVLEGGVIGRGDVVSRYLPAERALAEVLAAEAAGLVREMPVGMKSESDDRFVAFWSLASPEAPGPPRVVDEAYVRALFGGTIAPHDAITIEPLAETSPFFADVLQAGDATIAAWRTLIAFFEDAPELSGAVFVSIGFYVHGPGDRPPLPRDALHGSVLPRLVLGFTPSGSAVGLFGTVVWT